MIFLHRLLIMIRPNKFFIKDDSRNLISEVCKSVLLKCIDIPRSQFRTLQKMEGSFFRQLKM